MKRSLSIASSVRSLPRAFAVLRAPVARAHVSLSHRQERRARLASVGPTQTCRFYALPSVPFTIVAMPALSPTMETGTLVKWAKKEGDKLEPGDLIAEVETDKATIGWEATEDGILAKLLVAAPAQGLKIGAPVALLAKNAADAAKLSKVTLADLASSSSSPASSSSAPAPTPTPAAATAASAAPSRPAASSKPLPKRVLRMPALSPTMEKGTLAKWGKQPGEKVEPGDLIAEVETDKATIGWESTEDGIMAKHLIVPGSMVALGTPVAFLVDKKEEIAQWANITVDDFTAASSAPAPASAPAAAPSAPSAPAPTSSAPSASASVSVPSPSASAASPSGGRVVASPRARMEAQARGVPLSSVRGSGPNGRVIAADVLEYVPPVTRAAPSASASASAFAPSAPAGSWASRVADSKKTVPHYYLTVELRVDALEKAVSTLQATHKDVTLTSALVLAAARSMATVPAVNAEWRGDVLRTHSQVHVNFLLPGSATALDNTLAPVLRGVEASGLRALSDELRRVKEASTKGTLSAADSAVGTFSVLDLSSFGVQQCAPIIVPNQAAALALGAVETRPQLDADGEKVRKTRVLVATLSCDHRVVDGAVGAQWLQQFKKLVEEPLTLLL